MTRREKKYLLNKKIERINKMLLRHCEVLSAQGKMNERLRKAIDMSVGISRAAMNLTRINNLSFPC